MSFFDVAEDVIFTKQALTPFLSALVQPLGEKFRVSGCLKK